MSGPSASPDHLPDVTTYRPGRLFVGLAGFFVANALIAELIGVKIFTLEDTLGLPPWNFNVFGQTGALQFSAGVLLWPFVFLMTDLLNEYYGRRGVQTLSFLTAGLILYAFAVIYAAIGLAPAGWWVTQSERLGVPDGQAAFRATFGQGLYIIIGSLTAFLVAQITDVIAYQRIRRGTGDKWLWLRATGSTLISQLVDSFVVLFVAFRLGPELFGGLNAPWPWSRILAVATVQYAFKLIMAVGMTPVIYWLHGLIDRYLGHTVAERMKARAAAGEGGAAAGARKGRKERG